MEPGEAMRCIVDIEEEPPVAAPAPAPAPANDDDDDDGALRPPALARWAMLPLLPWLLTSLSPVPGRLPWPGLIMLLLLVLLLAAAAWDREDKDE